MYNIGSLVGLVAGDGRGGEATGTDPAVGEVKAKEALGVAKRLRGSDGVAQVLDDVLPLGGLGQPDGLHVGLELLVALLGGVSGRLVSLGEHELALAVG